MPIDEIRNEDRKVEDTFIAVQCLLDIQRLCVALTLVVCYDTMWKWQLYIKNE